MQHMSRTRDYFTLQSRRELDKIGAITRDTYHGIAVVLGVDLRVRFSAYGGGGQERNSGPPWDIGGDFNDAPTQSIALPHVPVKALDGRLQVTLSNCRLYGCERCHDRIRICRYCDHGNRFCQPCSPLARAEKQCNAGKRYQKTNNGRLNHKVRREEYRDRLEKNGTHREKAEERRR